MRLCICVLVRACVAMRTQGHCGDFRGERLPWDGAASMGAVLLLEIHENHICKTQNLHVKQNQDFGIKSATHNNLHVKHNPDSIYDFSRCLRGAYKITIIFLL